MRIKSAIILGLLFPVFFQIQVAESRLGLFNGDFVIRPPSSQAQRRKYNPVSINYSPVYEVKEYRGFGNRQIAGNHLRSPILSKLSRTSGSNRNFNPLWRRPTYRRGLFGDLSPAIHSPFHRRHDIPYAPPIVRRSPVLSRSSSNNLLRVMRFNDRYFRTQNRLVRDILRDPVKRRICGRILMKYPNLVALLYRISSQLRERKLTEAIAHNPSHGRISGINRLIKKIRSVNPRKIY